jgi:L-amino acid N-acyltransferase YncA
MGMEQLFRRSAGSLAMQRLRFDKPEEGIRQTQAVVFQASSEALRFFCVLRFRIWGCKPKPQKIPSG